MAFYPFDISTPHIAYVVLGGFTVFFGMFSLVIREKLYIGEAIWAFLFGIAMGPYGANIFSPRSWATHQPDVIDEITLEVTRVVLAIGVFAIGVELPNAYMYKHWKSLFYLLVPVMTYGWFTSAALIYALIPGLAFLPSLVVAACLTPTDPILAAAVVGGKYADKHVPEHLRHLLSAESGCNDGAAFPFLFIALYLVLEPNDLDAVSKWFYITWLYEIILGIVLGAVVGFAFRHLMKFCESHDLIDRKSYVAQYVSLAMLSDGMTSLLGSDDLLAAFASGTAFAWDGFFNKQTEQSVFSSVIDLLFNVACFIYIGAWMPFSDFTSEELTLSVWRLVVLGLAILVLRRLPIMMAIWKLIPDVKTFREAVFAGHFGPIGVGAVFISTLAKSKLSHVENPSAEISGLAHTIEPVVAFMVLCSILIHGLSIPFFSLGRTVSRTWSRHAEQPDWATHVRRVSKAEDIVVNRDDRMERGEKTITSTSAQQPYGTPEEGGGSGSAEGSTPVKESPASLPHELDEGAEGEQQMVMREWREGRHLVIERCGGMGKEPEVEVIHDAYADSITDERSPSGGVSHRFQVARDRVEQEVKKSLATLRQLRSRAKERAAERVERVEGAIADESALSSRSVTPTELESGGRQPQSSSREEADEWDDEGPEEADITDEDKSTAPDHAGSASTSTHAPAPAAARENTPTTTTITIQTPPEIPEPRKKSSSSAKAARRFLKPAVFIRPSVKTRRRGSVTRSSAGSAPAPSAPRQAAAQSQAGTSGAGGEGPAAPPEAPKLAPIIIRHSSTPSTPPAAQTPTTARTPTSSAEDATDQARGRRTPLATRPSSSGGASGGADSPNNGTLRMRPGDPAAQLLRQRLELSRRESSPARAVRFAAQDPVRPSTPLASAAPTPRGHRTPASQSVEDLHEAGAEGSNGFKARVIYMNQT